MHELVYLKDILIILGIAVIVVVGFHRLKLPAIAGLILSGIIVGPNGFSLIDDPFQVEILAEIGVALLLFGIGLELPLNKLRRLWKLAIIGGILQVGLTVLATYIVASISGLSDNSAIMIGFIVALSSTAVVLKGLQQRGEVDALHGRLILGILVFQDFSVVPIMLSIPLLTGIPLNPGELTETLAKSIGIILFVILSAIVFVPRVLRFVAQTGQRQLFILSVFVICLGTAWFVTYSGASLAIGAFLAGLVVAGSEYRHQALSDMISIRDIFSSIFFVSIGMLLLLDVIYDNLFPILQILIAILLGKSAIVFFVSMIMRMPLRIGIISALALSQIGEFSLVLFYSIQDKGIVSKALESNMISAAILSMFITPFFLAFGPKLAAGLGKLGWLKIPASVKSVEESSINTCTMLNHIIIGGYGFAGRLLAQSLKENNIPFIIVDINIENVRKAASEISNAVFGDITSQSVLSQLGIQNALELVILINDRTASEQAVQTARRQAANLFISVRTNYMSDIEPLRKFGANEIITSEREAAVQVVARVLHRNIDEADFINRIIDKYRVQDENS